MNQETPERRGYIRVGMQLLVSYVVIDEIHESRETIAKDISGGGIRLPVKEKLSVGTLLQMKLELLKRSRRISVEGRVVWIKPAVEDKDCPYEAGVEFIGLDPVERNMISNHVQYLSRSELVKEFFR